MAGGIDWFRWHHGSVTDPKFQLVARRSGASLPEVLAVWTYLLEKASAADFRGCFGEIDSEAVDCLFGLSEGATDAILAAMVDRKLIADEYIVAWEKRQPKREDDTAAERKRRQREREHELKLADRVTVGESRAVTQGHASVTRSHDRGEESREELIQEPPPLRGVPPEPEKAVEPKEPKQKPVQRPDDVDAEVWGDWLTLRKSKRAPVTATVVDGARSEAKKAGMELVEFLRIWCRRGSQGLEASWLHENERTNTRVAGGSFIRAPTSAELRVMQAVPGYAAPHLRAQMATAIRQECIDVDASEVG